MQTRNIDVSGTSTTYIEQGQGDPLVLVHGSDFGAGSGAFAWYHNIKPLSEHYRVIAPDRLGQGATDAPKSDGDYTIDAVMDHLESFLDQLGVKEATIAGSSRGAFIACYMAMRRPDLVGRIVMTNSASLAPAYAAYHYPARRNLRGTPESVRADNEWLSYSHAHITTEWERIVAERLRSQTIKLVREKFSELKPQYYASFDLAKRETINWLRSGFDKPSLTIWGLSDPMSRLEDAMDVLELMTIERGFPRMYLIDRCGHLPFAEYPEEFNGVVRTFIETSRTAGELAVGSRR